MELGLTADAAAVELDALLSTLQDIKRQVYDEVVAQTQPDAGERRILNAILTMPPAEMPRQLQCWRAE